MKNCFFLTILGLFFLWSCGSDSTKNADSDISQNADNKIIEEEVTNTQTKQVKIDDKFSSFLKKFAKTSLPYKEDPKGEEKYDKIPVSEQVSYLSKAEDLSATELEEMKDYTDFYYVSNPVSTNNYNAIVYGRFEMGSVYYFLCTYDNSGKLISHIDFASYEMMAAGPQAGHEYYTKGVINDKHEIVVSTEEETTKYKIKENGEIVKQ